MPDPARKQRPKAATEAEALDRELEAHGDTAWLIVPPTGLPYPVFHTILLPTTPQAGRVAQLMRARFFKEPQFQRDLFGWLLVQGRVLQLFAERAPRVRLDNVAVAW